jgi:hypothetical protein
VNWDAVIERNRALLSTLVASLIALAGWAEMPAPGTAALPRALRLAILRLLLPAESAVRRLIILAAQGLSVDVPPARAKRSARPKPVPVFWQGRRVPFARFAALAAAGLSSPHTVPARPPARRMAFALADRRKRFGRRRFVPAHRTPRILSLDCAFLPLPPRPAASRPDDPVGAHRVALRLAAIRTALDDIGAQARRLAVRQARASVERALDPHGPPKGRQLSPRRLGHPPGYRRRQARAIDAILADCESFAREAEGAT